MSKDHKIEIGANFQENIIKRFLLKASKNVDIITWAISDFSIKLNENQFVKISTVLKELISTKGVGIRIIFGNKNNIGLVKQVFSFPGCEVRLLEPNHSKIMLIDDLIGYVGSGNFTGAGLGSNWNKKHFNLEVSVLFWEKKDILELKRFFEIAWKYSIPI